MHIKQQSAQYSLFLSMHKWLLLASVFACLVSCKKDKQEEVQVQVSFQNTSGKTPVNRNYSITAARLYLSHFSVVDSNGNETAVKDIFLADKNSGNAFSFTLPYGSFSKLRYHFGIDPQTNHDADPASFDASHPLSLSHDMYWGMLRYRFIVAEGTVDSSASKNQTPANPFSMHLGTDTLYREITANIGTIKRGSTIHITIDLAKLFPLDENDFYITNFSNHSEPSEIPAAIRIVENLMTGIHTELKN
jgi:hypothetical protein